MLLGIQREEIQDKQWMTTYQSDLFRQPINAVTKQLSILRNSLLCIWWLHAPFAIFSASSQPNTGNLVSGLR